MSNTHRPGLQIPDCQAARIFAKFGGARKLAKALSHLEPVHHRDVTALYRWASPKAKGGTGGLVPSSAWPSVKLAARYEGIVLSAEDCAP